MLDLALFFACLLATGFACQWLAWRAKLPAILFLLLAGIALGPIAGVLDPDALLGDLLGPVVSLGVAIVLFEGSLALRLEQARGLGRTILLLVSVGALITLGALASAAHWLVGLGWPLAALFGALVTVTGPTVIMPMLRSVRPRERVANVLRWEAILIDPIGALLAVLVFQALVSDFSPHSLQVFGLTVLTGLASGVSGALLLGWLLRRRYIPEYLQVYGTLTLVLLAFAGANALMHESGLLAVTVMGLVLGNQRDLRIEEILDFKENLSTMLISGLFVLLAARLDPHLPVPTLAAGLGLLLFAQFAVRPLAAFACTLGSKLEWRERALLAWIAPRGIVAAAVSALFALRLQALGEPGAGLLVPLTFLMIIGTVLLQSATAAPLARWLGVADPEASGVLIVGSGRLARALGEALAAHKLAALIADEDWTGVSAARMAGLRTFFGNPVSERADRQLDLVGIGNLFAMSTHRELNTLACVRYRPEFGAGHVFFLRNVAQQAGESAEFAQALAAPKLFGEFATLGDLEERLARGWHIKSTRLSADFGMQQFSAQYGEGALPLFAVTERGRLRVAASDRALDPGPGWSVTALVPPEAAEAAAPAKA
jgi:NhaP-type Na+/H+ or K+/H+ antiporter